MMIKTLQYLSLGGASVRDTQLSDHEPIIKEEALSWNIMMPGKFKNNRYNNGFGLVETQEDYHTRLRSIAMVLAETLSQNPHISMISLQEGPVQPEDIAVFVKSCASFTSLRPFLPSLCDPKVYTSWGLISLVNSERFDYEVQQVPEAQGHLQDRIQRVNLREHATDQCSVLTNLHLPYLSKQEPYKMARMIYKMMSNQVNANFVLMGDFNFSFTDIQLSDLMKSLGQVFAPRHNSTELHLENGGTSTMETVDAIISNQIDTEQPFKNLKQTSLLRFTRAYPMLTEPVTPHESNSNRAPHQHR